MVACLGLAVPAVLCAAGGVPQRMALPPAGSASPPAVSVTADWHDLVRAVPEEYRLIRGDGQKVSITATVVDPCGIEQLTLSVGGMTADFHGDGAPRMTRSWTFANDDPALTAFTYGVTAVNRAGLSSRADGGSYVIADLADLKLTWSAAMKIRNAAGPSRLPWERMVQTFGVDECWVKESWDWRRLRAHFFYRGRFGESSAGGQCFGLAASAIEFPTGRISPCDLEPGRPRNWGTKWSSAGSSRRSSGVRRATRLLCSWSPW